jgi:hypothetical protein
MTFGGMEACTRHMRRSLEASPSQEYCIVTSNGREPLRNLAEIVMFDARALSSAGRERLPYKQEAAGSNPAAPIARATGIIRPDDPLPTDAVRTLIAPPRFLAEPAPSCLLLPPAGIGARNMTRSAAVASLQHCVYFLCSSCCTIKTLHYVFCESFDVSGRARNIKASDDAGDNLETTCTSGDVA